MASSRRLSVLQQHLSAATTAVDTSGQVSLVIGGSGPTGIHLIEGLLERGQKVYMLHVSGVVAMLIITGTSPY